MSKLSDLEKQQITVIESEGGGWISTSEFTFFIRPIQGSYGLNFMFLAQREALKKKKLN